MNTITGTVKNGCVILDAPTELRDGSRVVVQPVEHCCSFGVSESDWQDTPEAIAEWIRWYESLEPIETSSADEQSLHDYRQRQKALAQATFNERAERLKEIWQ